MRRIRTHEDGQGLTELCAVYAPNGSSTCECRP